LQALQANVRCKGFTPFYERCNFGKPIVDLCLALVASNPYNRVESILMQYGILQVDRDTVKGYALAFRDRAIKKAGIPVMDSFRCKDRLVSTY